MRKNIIGIIGGGNMGEALVRGLYKTHSVVVVDPSTPRVMLLKKKYDVEVSEIEILVPDKSANIIILAVKPQDMEGVLKRYTQTDGKLFISIAAGLTTKFLEKHLGGKVRVVRAMPNLPALINEGITGICAGKYATRADLKTSQRILSAIGKTVVVKEAMMDVVTAVSGSGPAYVFLFVEQWMAAAIALGFSKEEAKQLIYKTLLGSAHLLEKSESDAAELRAKVTSKGGTTEAAMKVFEENNFGKLMKDALTAAKKRAKELAK